MTDHSTDCEELRRGRLARGLEEWAARSGDLSPAELQTSLECPHRAHDALRAMWGPYREGLGA